MVTLDTSISILSYIFRRGAEVFNIILVDHNDITLNCLSLVEISVFVLKELPKILCGVSSPSLLPIFNFNF